MNIEDLDRDERENIDQLRSRIAAVNPNSIPTDDFHYILLQRYWVSQEFTHIYDAALDRLDSEADVARPVIRRIIREEYPNDRGAWRTPSHREDLITDLLGVGVTWIQFKASRPSLQTRKAIANAREVVYDTAGKPYPNVGLLAFLRAWGEVFSAIEYEELISRIRKLLKARTSVFYKHHLAHDARIVALTDILKNVHVNTHADKLGKCLIAQVKLDWIDSAAALAAAQEAARKALQNKLEFWAQFSGGMRDVPRGRWSEIG